MHRVRHTTPEVEQRARELRQEATPAEQILWDALRAAGRAQVPASAPRRAVHPRFLLREDPSLYRVGRRSARAQRDRDMAPDATLFAHGIVTLRFTNEQVLHNLG